MPARQGDEIYSDAESRAFYESLPDLRSVLPAVLFDRDGDAAAAAEESKLAVDKLLSSVRSLAPSPRPCVLDRALVLSPSVPDTLASGLSTARCTWRPPAEASRLDHLAGGLAGE